jgi:hypothetical protein
MARYRKVVCYLTPEQLEGLHRFRRITGAPVQKYVRVAVDQFLDSYEKQLKKKAASAKKKRAPSR